MSEEVKKEEPVNTEIRKTTVTKFLTRKYNLGNYESVDISTSTTDEITWKTAEERQRKIASLDKLLLDSHVKSVKAAAVTLKIPYLDPENPTVSSVNANINEK